MMPKAKNHQKAMEQLRLSRLNDGSLLIAVQGVWSIHSGLPDHHRVIQDIENLPSKKVSFRAEALESWDSSLLSYLTRLKDELAQLDVGADFSGLPDGVKRLLQLADAVPEKEGARRSAVKSPWVQSLGERSLVLASSAREMVDFVGEVTMTLMRFFSFRARFRRSDLFLYIQDCGIQALPIITLISFLVGLILAFVGAVQLQQFGASIYVANLVGIAMVREMGAMMTAIIMAGRTGAAFAAQLGTMKVTQEIDALTTMGISPMEFLVLPRMIALSLMLPLLCIYSDLIGMIGGSVVGIGMLDIAPSQYLDQTQYAVTLTDCLIGIVKSVFFGVLIAVAGCLRGMQCGNSAAAVGDASTSAVVTSLVMIIVSDGVFAVLLNVIGI